MGKWIIIVLAMVSVVACMIFCFVEISKDIRRFIRQVKLIRWASKMLEASREQSAEGAKATSRPIIQFAQPNSVSNPCGPCEELFL